MSLARPKLVRANAAPEGKQSGELGSVWEVYRGLIREQKVAREGKPVSGVALCLWVALTIPIPTSASKV